MTENWVVILIESENEHTTLGMKLVKMVGPGVFTP